jgi:DNA-binding HxlR family transcriptional regulator
MKRTSFDGMNCSLARTLDVIGEWWTLLIIREASWGTSRFDEFHQRLGIARNVLAARLERLEETGILERKQSDESARIFDYLLTEKGWDLFPILVAMIQWGDRWIHSSEGPPIQFFDRSTGKEIKSISIQNVSGKTLLPFQLDIRPGPGADSATVKRANSVLE